jgi:serine/threonine protein kinase
MLTHLDDDDDEQRILLADFGIARNVDDISGLTATNIAVGTVAYAAPEQFRCPKIGRFSDGRESVDRGAGAWGINTARTSLAEDTYFWAESDGPAAPNSSR